MGDEQGLRSHYSPTGTICSRMWIRDNRQHGEQLIYHDNGTIRAHFSCLNGSAHGEYRWYSDDGTLRSLDFFRNGMLHGKQLSYHANGRLRSRCWRVDGKLQGQRVEYTTDGAVATTKWYQQDTMVPRDRCSGPMFSTLNAQELAVQREMLSEQERIRGEVIIVQHENLLLQQYRLPDYVPPGDQIFAAQ